MSLLPNIQTHIQAEAVMRLNVEYRGSTHRLTDCPTFVCWAVSHEHESLCPVTEIVEMSYTYWWVCVCVGGCEFK